MNRNTMRKCWLLVWFLENGGILGSNKNEYNKIKNEQKKYKGRPTKLSDFLAETFQTRRN
jgi:hypothetical protein